MAHSPTRSKCNLSASVSPFHIMQIGNFWTVLRITYMVHRLKNRLAFVQSSYGELFKVFIFIYLASYTLKCKHKGRKNIFLYLFFFARRWFTIVNNETVKSSFYIIFDTSYYERMLSLRRFSLFIIFGCEREYISCDDVCATADCAFRFHRFGEVLLRETRKNVLTSPASPPIGALVRSGGAFHCWTSCGSYRMNSIVRQNRKQHQFTINSAILHPEEDTKTTELAGEMTSKPRLSVRVLQFSGWFHRPIRRPQG